MSDDQERRAHALGLAGNDVSQARQIYAFLWPAAEENAWVPEVKTTPWYIVQARDGTFGTAYVSFADAEKVCESLSQISTPMKLYRANCETPICYEPKRITPVEETQSDEPGVLELTTPDINGGQG